MGYRMFVDGNCRKCGRQSVYYCDACMLYFCDEHMKKAPVHGTTKSFMLCEKCHAAKKTPIDPYRTGL